MSESIFAARTETGSNPETTPDHTNYVCVGQIVGVHGVRGAVKLRSFTADPLAILRYGPLRDESGQRQFRITLDSPAGDPMIARIAGIADRTSAESLRGVKLYVPRTVLPPPEEDEFYHADLIGLRAEMTDGTFFGTVMALHDFGAGDILELKPDTGPSVMLPFTQAMVPVVDLRRGRLVIDPPTDWLTSPPPAQQSDMAEPDPTGESPA